jgi:hypothetical protein
VPRNKVTASAERKAEKRRNQKKMKHSPEKTFRTFSFRIGRIKLFGRLHPEEMSGKEGIGVLSPNIDPEA